MDRASYLIVVNDMPSGQGKVRGDKIVNFLMHRGIWVFPEYAHHLRKLQPGDQLIIYLAGRQAREFVANAKVASTPTLMPEALKHEVAQLGLRWFNWYVNIIGARYLNPPRPISRLIHRLYFVTDKKNYGLSLRQGIRRLDERDVKIILGK